MKEYPTPNCMECKKYCKIHQEVNTNTYNGKGWSRIQLWCYCENCDIETFILIPSDEKYYPE